MLPGLYSASTGLNASIKNQEVIANNLANVSVPGFRRSYLTHQSFENTLKDSDRFNLISANLGTNVDETRSDFRPGIYERTGRTLDVALNGDAFFVLEGDNGPIYTRAGSFQIGPEGSLVNHEGRPVSGDGGPIELGNGVSESQIEITTDGTVRARGAVVGKLQVVAFEDNHKLNAIGTTLFEASDESVEKDTEVIVQPGFREQSNVSIPTELVNMIVGMRFYEMAQRAMSTLSDTIQQRINLQQQGG